MSYKSEKLKELSTFTINSSLSDEVYECLASNKALLKITRGEELLLSYYKPKTRWSTKSSELFRLWEREFEILTQYYTLLKERGADLEVLAQEQRKSYLKSEYKCGEKEGHRAFLKTFEIRLRIVLS